MSDRIELRGIRALGVHGVLPEERSRPQPFLVDVDLAVDLRPAGASDDLADTVDYAAVAAIVAGVVGGERSYRLLEALAARIANETLGLDSRISEAAVRVAKLRPPLAADVGTVGVRVVRSR